MTWYGACGTTSICTALPNREPSAGTKVDGAATSLNETDDSCCGAKILCATGKATTGPPMIGLPIGMGATGSIGLIDGVAGATTICKAPRKGIGKTGLILAKKHPPNVVAKANQSVHYR